MIISTRVARTVVRSWAVSLSTVALTGPARADWVSQLLLETGWAGRLASFGEDEAGEIYVVDLNGALYRLGDTLQVADLPARAFLPLMVKSP